MLYVLAFTPVLEGILGELSLGWLLAIIAAVGATFIRGALGLILGQNVADGLLSHLLRDLVVLPFRVFGAVAGMVCAVLSRIVFRQFAKQKHSNVNASESPVVGEQTGEGDQAVGRASSTQKGMEEETAMAGAAGQATND